MRVGVRYPSICHRQLVFGYTTSLIVVDKVGSCQPPFHPIIISVPTFTPVWCWHEHQTSQSAVYWSIVTIRSLSHSSLTHMQSQSLPFPSEDTITTTAEMVDRICCDKIFSVHVVCVVMHNPIRNAILCYVIAFCIRLRMMDGWLTADWLMV